ncbi:MAG: hypothetical protein ACOC4Y_02330 [bacterium]
MTIINRRKKFIYLKSRKTAGTSVEIHLLSNTHLGGDIWNTAGEIVGYGMPRTKRNFIVPAFGKSIMTVPGAQLMGRIWPWRFRIHEHHDANSLSKTLNYFWDDSIKATNARNPWDLMVSAWQWRRDGRGGATEPTTACFEEWLRAGLSGDYDWQKAVQAYDPSTLLHPFLFLNGRCAVDVVIKREAINDGLLELGRLLNAKLGSINIYEKKSSRNEDYRRYYSSELAEKVAICFSDVIKLLNYEF